MKERISRFTVLLSVLTILVVFVYIVPASAARPSTHEIIVSQDNDGDFTTIADALNSITDASASNRYLITIKPGTYTIPQFITIDYVDINGSGIENTIINRSLNEVRNSHISNLSIIGDYIDAVLIWGSGTASFKNVYIESSSCDTLRLMNDATLKISDSTIVLNSGCSDGWALRDGSSGQWDIENTIIESNYQGILNGGTLSLRNSVINAGTNGVSGGQPAYIYNSQISAQQDAISITTQGGFIAGSQISGNINGYIKLVNCYDANFNPIPNQ